MAAKKRGRFINWQKTRTFETKGFRGEKSPYWSWLEKQAHAIGDSDGGAGELREPSRANPDILVDPELENTPTINTRALMRETIKKVKFSRVEKAVLNYIGIQGFTEEKTAEKLGISRLRVRTCLSRAQKKCEKVFGAISGLAGVIGRETHSEDES